MDPGFRRDDGVALSRDDKWEWIPAFAGMTAARNQKTN